VSKPESKIKNRFIVFRADANLPGIPWSDVARNRTESQHVVYELAERGRGTLAELAAMDDPDAPVIEVQKDDDVYIVVCGEYAWDGDGWANRIGDAWHFDTDFEAGKIAALLRKHKDYPPVVGGGK